MNHLTLQNEKNIPTLYEKVHDFWGHPVCSEPSKGSPYKYAYKCLTYTSGDGNSTPVVGYPLKHDVTIAGMEYLEFLICNRCN